MNSHVAVRDSPVATSGWFRVALLAITLAALGLHLWFLRCVPVSGTPDTIAYAASARGVLAGHGFVDSTGNPDTVRTPVYPLFLAAMQRLGVGYTTVALLQHVLCVLASVIIALFLARSGRPVEGLIAAALTGFDTAQVVSANLVMTEALFAFVVVVGSIALCGALRASSWALATTAGIAFGVAPLVRPIAIFLAVPLVAIAMWRTPNRRSAVVLGLLIPSFLFPAAWVLRNRQVSGVATLTSIIGENMLFWRAAGTLAMNDLPRFIYGGSRERDYQRLFFRVYQKELRREIDPQIDARLGGAIPHAVRAAEYERAGRQIILGHLTAFVRCALNGVIHLVLDPAVDFAEKTLGPPARDFALWWMTLARIVTMIAAVTGIVVLWFADRSFALVVITVLVYLTIMSAGPEGNFLSTRFRAPLAPFEAIVAAFAARGLRSTMK